MVDNLTNNIRGSWRSQADSLQQLVNRVDRLRQTLLAAKAAAVVVIEVKPMRIVDVRPFNRLLSEYLRNCGTSGYGCKTQIRMEFLKPDGYHINPYYDSVIDRTYACALRGIEVPCPTPEQNFIPDFVRHRKDQDWPRLVGQGMGWGTCA